MFKLKSRVLFKSFLAKPDFSVETFLNWRSFCFNVIIYWSIVITNAQKSID